MLSILRACYNPAVRTKVSMELDEPSGLSPRWRRWFAREHRAFWLIAVNGILFQLSWALFDARYVVAAFLTTLTGREWVVGLANSIQATAMMLPQLYASHLVSDGRARMPLYVRGAQIRWIALGVITFGVLALAHYRTLTAVLFLTMIGVMGMGVGLGVVAFGDIVTRTVQPHRRGRLFGVRLTIGGLLSFVLGLLVKWLLSDHSPLGWPANYALLFGVSLLFLITAQLCFMRIEEPPCERRTRPAATFRQFVAHAARVLREDRAARRFACYRLLTPIAWSPMLFITPYMMNRFGFSDDVVGPLVSSGVVAGALSNVLWAALSDRVGNRIVIRLGASLAVLSIAMLAAAPEIMQRFDGPSVGPVTFYWLLVANGLVQMCVMAGSLAGLNYLYELAPRDEVPLYVGLLNTITAPVTAIAAPLAGWLAGRYSYELIFIAGALAGLAAVGTTLRLDEPRQR